MAGILTRLLVVLLADNRLNPPWGGLGDAPAYFLLAHNIATGKGYAYAGFATAYRPPIYPLLLAGGIKVFDSHAFEAVRLVQFLMGLAVVYLCASVAGNLFGKDEKRAALVLALFFPTLVIMTGDILTEATATLISALFLYLFVRFFQRPSWAILAGLSVCVGVATLIRFNMALLGIVVLAVVLLQQKTLPKWRAAALMICLSGLVVSPWLVRNYRAFHGRLLLSTESGPAAVMGVLTPQGRALPGDSARLRRALGWVPPADIETNAPSRAQFGSEAELNRKAWRVAFGLWRHTGWRLVPLTLEKLSYFWLSTDQLLWTRSFRPLVRAARAGGVLVYWVLLAFGIAGWFRLRSRSSGLARVFLFYVILATVLHVPFNMNTRLRMPFIDPLLAILAAGQLSFFNRRASPVRESAQGLTSSEAR
ncbi:MAG: ArnT family glycosyltransferase [Candidatus Acidiferrales bacterium]